VLSQLSFGLLCAWREVLILRQQKQPGRKLGPNRAEMGLGRPAWVDRPSPLWGRFGAPSALGVRLFIASAAVGYHIEQIILPMPLTEHRRRKMRERVR
jgi:hypothetical protein